jgi:predicted O-methyltransferase YrrM
MDNIFPQITTAAEKCAAEHISAMQTMLKNWYAHSGVQWTPGMIVTPELAARFDTFVPWQQVARSLRRVARAFLPSEEWIPMMLRDGTLETLLDLWQELPEICGRAAPEEDALLEFFCACADPPRYGTDAGRYPQQLKMLQELNRPAKLLDLGCGIGLGTLEMSDALGTASACGVTIEPLEVWMAERRTLPHDPRRTAHFQRWKHLKNVTFRAADITSYHSDEQYDMIVCNGLVGGRFLNSRKSMETFLDCLEMNVTPEGIFAAANSFHQGNRENVERFLHTAAARGWKVEGTWQNAILCRHNR